MNAGAWNTNVHKQAIVKLSDGKAPVGLARKMIFDIRIVLMIFRQFIDECLISSICSHGFGANYKYMLHQLMFSLIKTFYCY